MKNLTKFGKIVNSRLDESVYGVIEYRVYSKQYLVLWME